MSGQLKNLNSRMLEDCEEFIHWPWGQGVQRNPKECSKDLKTPMAPAMPCKRCNKRKNGKTRSKSNDFKSKFACILEAGESTRLRMEESLPNYHEDHIAGRGHIHYNITIWCTKFLPMLQAMKILAAKAAVDTEWKKLEKIPAWD